MSEKTNRHEDTAATVDHEQRLREYAEWGGKDSTYGWALDEIARLREEIRIREESQIPVIPHGAAVQLERLQVDNERLLAWHDKTVPVIAALAIYGEGASLPALVEKARALNEAHRG